MSDSTAISEQILSRIRNFLNTKEHFLKHSGNQVEAGAISLTTRDIQFIDVINTHAANIASVLELPNDPEIWEALGDLAHSHANELRR